MAYNKNRSFRVSDYTPIPTDEIEALIISEMVQSPDMIPLAKTQISSKMFSSEALRKVWETILDWESKGRKIDISTIHPEVDKTTFDNILSPRYGNPEGSYTSVNAHCNSLRKGYLQRLAFFAGIELVEMASKGGADTEALLSIPKRLEDTLVSNYGEDCDSSPLADCINEVAKDLEDRSNGKSPRIPTSFPLLDYATLGGLEAGNLAILSARPSVGKTSVMLQMARASSNAGVPTLIFSKEQSKKALAQRLLQSTNKISPSDMARGEIDWAKFEEAGKISSLPIFVNDKASTIEDITSGIISNNSRGKCGIAFIDYLHLFLSGNMKNLPSQEISSFTKRLKALAMDLSIPIVLLCQLNRNSVEGNRPPELYDLRDSGAIEQDADIVLMLQELGYKEDGHPHLCLWIRKNRGGKRGGKNGDGRIELVVDSTYTNFVECEA